MYGISSVRVHPVERVPPAARFQVLCCYFDPHISIQSNMATSAWASRLAFYVLSCLAECLQTMILLIVDLSTGCHAASIGRVSFQGASGLIFLSGGDPVDKTVIIPCLDSKGHTQIVHAVR